MIDRKWEVVRRLPTRVRNRIGVRQALDKNKFANKKEPDMNRTLLATAILALALGGCNNSERAKADAERAKAEADKAKAELELAKLKAAGGQQPAERSPNKSNNLDLPGKPKGFGGGPKDPLPKDPLPKDPPQGAEFQIKPDKDAIQGDWTVISGEYHGKVRTAEDLATMWVTIEGDKFTFWERGTVNVKATITLDPTKNPNQIDFKSERNEVGIYDMHSTWDTLVLCIDDTGKQRPVGFEDSRARFVLKRKTGTAKGTQTKSDKDAIQGTWIVVAGEAGGAPVPANALPKMSYVFAGDKYTFREGTLKTEASFTLNPAKKTKQIDVKMKDGFTQLGIYELWGDELKICLNSGNKRRPDSFATTVENINETHFLKRK